MKEFVGLFQLIELLERREQCVVDQILSVFPVLRNDQGIAREPVMDGLEELEEVRLIVIEIQGSSRGQRLSVRSNTSSEHIGS